MRYLEHFQVDRNFLLAGLSATAREYILGSNFLPLIELLCAQICHGENVEF